LKGGRKKKGNGLKFEGEGRSQFLRISQEFPEKHLGEFLRNFLG